MDLPMTIILSKKHLTEEIKNNLLVQEKTLKSIDRRIDKNGEVIAKHIFYTLQFIDNARFMARSLSNLVNNLSEGIHRIKCKFVHEYKKCKTCRIKYKDYDCFLEYTNFKDDLIEYKCLVCNKN